MEEIARFVLLARSDRFTLTELCEQFGISRKTAYKHLERFEAEGLKGLQPRSHCPHTFPQRTDAAMEALVLAERRLHRRWGPKKLQRVLAPSRRGQGVFCWLCVDLDSLKAQERLWRVRSGWRKRVGSTT